jgi:alanine-glyoxylate transaminase / serine-glyoxylate transaminase / serine-pyruvate transaminase
MAHPELPRVMPTPTRIPGHRFLHSPGPTRVPDEVLHAMSRQPMDLADPRVAQVIAACESGLKRLLQTRDADVLLFAANGHGVWEGVIANLLGPGDSVLVPGTGQFSDGWSLQAEAFGARAIRTPWIEGTPIDANAVEQALRADPQHRIKAVFVVHTDTASGVTSDMGAMRAALDAARHPALLVIDVVASLGAAPFAMDALGANVVVGASQKGLMLPPGLGFIAVDERALQVASQNPAPRFYWDWARRRGELSYQKFCGTPPHSLLMGLEAALDLIFLEGVEVVLARHASLARAVHAAVECWSEGGALRFLAASEAARSTSVTAIAVNPGIDVEQLRSIARERFQVAIAGGLGPLAGRVFRIGHLGDMNPAMILGALAGVEAALQAQDVPLRSGLAAATQVLARG